MMDLKENGYAEVGEMTVENLVIKKGRIDLAVIAVASGALELKRGQVLFAATGGKLAATGDAGKARAILARDITAEAAGDVTAEVFLSGIFNKNGITGTLAADDIDALRARDIYVEVPAS
jgi:hypothetical protein